MYNLFAIGYNEYHDIHIWHITLFEGILMEIRNLRYFLAVAREENMSRAAELLHVTQPTLSKALKSHPLAKKKSIKVADLIGQPLFCSEQSWNIEIPEWAGENFSKLHLEGSFRLSYNASMFAKEGLGILLTFEHLIDCSEESDLVFRPLSPKQETKLYLIWNKYQTFTPIAEKFLAQVREAF